MWRKTVVVAAACLVGGSASKGFEGPESQARTQLDGLHHMTLKVVGSASPCLEFPETETVLSRQNICSSSLSLNPAPSGRIQDHFIYNCDIIDWTTRIESLGGLGREERRVNDTACLRNRSSHEVHHQNGPLLQRIEHYISRNYQSVTSTSTLLVVIFSLALYLVGSVFFDIGHYALHQMSKSRYRILRRVGYLHEVHHLYFNRRLKFNNKYRWQNMALELPLELGCQLCGTFLGYLVAHSLGLTGPGLLTRELLNLVMYFQVLRSLVVAILEGHDSNHKSYQNTIPKDPNTFLVGPEFHAMHHVDPSAYIGSSIRLFDWLIGTSYTLHGRRITMTGTSGAFASAMKKAIDTESVSCINELKFGLDWTYDDYAGCISTLEKTDILILGHGSQTNSPMEANCTSANALIALFKKHRVSRKGDLLLPEIWYLGSELEVQPAWGSTVAGKCAASKREFARSARKYYDDEEVMYRHIAVSPSASGIGRALLGPEWAASWAMWWIRRGARFVPTSCVGFTSWDYFKFLYWDEKSI